MTKDEFAKKLIIEFEKGKYKKFIWYGATTYIQTKYGFLLIYLEECNPPDYKNYSYRFVDVNIIKKEN